MYGPALTALIGINLLNVFPSFKQCGPTRAPQWFWLLGEGSFSACSPGLSHPSKHAPPPAPPQWFWLDGDGIAAAAGLPAGTLLVQALDGEW